MNSIIIDTDADFDDFIAIAWLNTCKNLDIKAITYVGCGWTRPPAGFDNLLQFLNLINLKPGIPIAAGETTPLSKHPSGVPQSLIDQCNRHWDTPLPNSIYPASSKHAVDIIINACQNSESPISLLLLGPLTNVALALQKEPSISKNIKAAYLTGGSTLKEENTHADHSIDNDLHLGGNQRSDLIAFEILHKAGIPVYALMPSAAECLAAGDDTLNQALNSKHPVLSFIRTAMTNILNLQKDMANHETIYLWDAVTAFCFMYSAFEFKTVSISIDPHASPEHVIRLSDKGFKQFDINVLDNTRCTQNFIQDMTSFYQA